MGDKNTTILKSKLKILSAFILILFLLNLVPFSTSYAGTTDVTTSATNQQSATSSSTTVSNTIPVTSSLGNGGDGEDYTLHLTYQAAPSNLTQAWLDLIKNLTGLPTNYVGKYEWKVFKLGFSFGLSGDGCTTMSPDELLNLTTMDSVISTIYSRGLKVVLSDYDWCMFGSHEWVQDWLSVTQHYKGDDRVLAFDLYNEPTTETWSYNVTTNQYNSNSGVESALSNATTRIQQLDSSRAVIWYAPYFQWSLYKPFERQNVLYDFHLYANTTQSWINAQIGHAVSFDQKYGVHSICLELNVQGRNGTNQAQTSYDIDKMNSLGIPWISWLFQTFVRFWIPVLDTANGAGLRAAPTGTVIPLWLTTALSYLSSGFPLLTILIIGTIFVGLLMVQGFGWKKINRNIKRLIASERKFYLENDFEEYDEALDHYM